MTAPAGPVSVEIPIDIQAALVDMPADLEPLPLAAAVPSATALEALADHLAKAKRPMLWLGGGARHAGAAVKRLAEMGIGVITSVQGRGVLPEDHAMCLGAFTLQAPVEKFYASCDAMLVVGSRLRSNETLTYKLKLPQPLYRVDCDAQMENRCYASERFVSGDSALALAGLADRLQGRMRIDPAFAADLAAARAAAQKSVRDGLGPYSELVDKVQHAAGTGFVWVRDITLSNSMWGNRLLCLTGSRDGVHALGGGIGQGVQMAIGAALAAGGRKTWCLVGDGGLQVNIGELATLVQEKADVIVLLMNDRGYGVIRNIQDAHYGARHCYVDLHTPDFAELAKSIQLPFTRLRELGGASAAFTAALARTGPTLIELDMHAIGPFATAFAGPPVKKAANV